MHLYLARPECLIASSQNIKWYFFFTSTKLFGFFYLFLGEFWDLGYKFKCFYLRNDTLWWPLPTCKTFFDGIYMYYKICIQKDLFTRKVILHCNLWIKDAVILLCIKCFIILPFESCFFSSKSFSDFLWWSTSLKPGDSCHGMWARRLVRQFSGRHNHSALSPFFAIFLLKHWNKIIC